MFNLEIFYNGNTIFTLPFDSATTDVDNWGTQTVYFESAPQETTDKGPQGFGFRVPANGGDSHLDIGLDAINISLSTFGQPQELNGSEDQDDGDLVNAAEIVTKRTEDPTMYSRIMRGRNTWRV